MRARNLTKLLPPLAGAERMPRHGLLDTLARSTQARIVVLLAPAGYGKTTLMAQWMQALAQQGASASWLLLDEFDNDPVRLMGYVLGAMKDWMVQALGAANDALQTGDWIGALEDIGPDAPAHTLFLDECDKLNAPPALQALKLLLAQLPAQVRVVIGTREKPALGLERHRLQGDLLELTAAELRFDADETARFLGERMHAALPAWVVERMQELTGGWPAALQLSALAARSTTDLARYASDLSGSVAHIADYLAEDVLQAQPADVRGFLLETCGLPRLNAVACQAATGRTDSQRLLLHLEQHGLFTMALDPARQWYRYHPLFAAFLRTQQTRELPPEQVNAIHRGAARWFARHGTQVEAVDLWLRAGDTEAALREMSACARGLIIQAQFGTILRWIDMLDEQGLAHVDPPLQLAASWACGFTGQAETARQWADALHRRLARHAGEAPCDLTDLADLTEVAEDLAALEAGMLAMSGHPGAALAHATAHWDRIRPANRFAAGALANVMSYGLMLQGDYARARTYSDQARACNEEIGSALGLGYAFSVSSMIEAAQGRLGAALELFKEVGRVAQRYLPRQWGDHSHLNIASLGLVSGLLYEMDELDQASELLQRYLPLVMHQPSMDMLLLTLIVHARLHAARGDIPAALEALTALDTCFPERGQLTPGIALQAAPQRASPSASQAHSHTVPHTVPHTAPQMAPQMARARRVLAWERFRIEWLAYGAATALAHAPLPDRTAQGDGDDLSGEGSFVEELCGQGIELIRHDLVAGHPASALARLATEIPKAEAAQRRWRLLKLWVLSVLAHDDAGDAGGRAYAVRQAQALAGEMGARRSLLDEGPRVAALLQAATMPQPQMASATASAATEALSEREHDILRLLAQGHGNEDIASRIFLSVHTVKWYVRRILEKLGARNRSEAVFLARQRGLLDGG